MNVLRNTAIGLVIFSSAAVTAGAANLELLAERLAQSAQLLATSSYRGFSDRDRGDPEDVEALFLARQFRAGARLFRQMVREQRPDSELRESAAILRSQARNSSRFSFGRREWQDMIRTLDEILRDLGTDRRSEAVDSLSVGGSAGRLRWRGRVDDEVEIRVQGSTATPRVINGSKVDNPSFSFTSALPASEVTVNVKKLNGRGDVKVIQQPSRENNFTAVVGILDKKAKSDTYEFDLTWHVGQR